MGAFISIQKPSKIARQFPRRLTFYGKWLTLTVELVILPSLTVKEAESPENAGFQPLFTHQKCSYILLFFSFLTGFLDA